jgi:hypothetical protein
LERGQEVPGSGGLIWYAELGYGYFPAKERGQFGQYDQAYFAKYRSYRYSPIAENLMQARADLVAKYCGTDPVVDVGIGSGHFIEARKGITYGYDVNPAGIRWLLDKGLWFDPFAESPDTVTCWDSLEHMVFPDLFVDRVRKFFFTSIPVFEGPEQVLRSKHFKPSEHLWYWSSTGFVRWMRARGFSCLEENRMECALGRVDIGTFVFSKAQ